MKLFRTLVLRRQRRQQIVLAVLEFGQPTDVLRIPSAEFHISQRRKFSIGCLAAFALAAVFLGLGIFFTEMLFFHLFHFLVKTMGQRGGMQRNQRDIAIGFDGIIPQRPQYLLVTFV